MRVLTLTAVIAVTVVNSVNSVNLQTLQQELQSLHKNPWFFSHFCRYYDYKVYTRLTLV